MLTVFCLLLVHNCAAYVGSRVTEKNFYVSSKTVWNAVDTTKIGSSVVPSVGIGTISWSSDKAFTLENEDLEKVVSKSFKSNASFFDTAERYGSHWKTALGAGYGDTEKMLSQYLEEEKLREGPREAKTKAFIASKFTPSPWRTSVKCVVDACEQSCKNLGVDAIDLYQIHMPDIVQPLRAFGQVETKDRIYWDGLAECYSRGLVKNVGVCNYGPTLLNECHEALAKKGVPLASNQISFSLLSRHNGSLETIDKCNELGVKVLAYYPFAMGLLTGKYSKPTSKTKESSLESNKKSNLELQDLERYALGDGISIPKGGIEPLITTMETIASRRRKSIAQVALNYIICKGAIPIPGCRTESQLDDNLGAMGWRLSATEVKMLELEADKLGFDFDGAGFKRTNEKFVGYGIERWALD